MTIQLIKNNNDIIINYNNSINIIYNINFSTNSIIITLKLVFLV